MPFFLKSLTVFALIYLITYFMAFLGFILPTQVLPMLLLGVAAYLFGSIPFGLVFTKLFEGKDLRQMGSGNIGATNVMRTGRKSLALATLICDAGKVALMIALTKHFHHTQTSVLWVASLGILGHLFPLWLSFKGGKGVASAAGAVLVLSWPVGVAAILTWLLVFLITRLSSLSAIAALALAPIVSYALAEPAPLTLWLLGLCALILVKHKENIMRLIQGQEGKIDFTSSKKDG